MKEVRQISEQVEKFSIGPQQDLRPKSEMTKFAENPRDYVGSGLLEISKIAIAMMIIFPLAFGIMIVLAAIVNAFAN